MRLRTILLILMLSTTAFAKPHKKPKPSLAPKQNNVLTMDHKVLGVMSDTKTCTAVAQALSSSVPTSVFDCVAGGK